MDCLYRLLAVDDEPDIQRTNCRYLEARGYQVDTAFCASEALDQLKSRPTTASSWMCCCRI